MVADEMLMRELEGLSELDNTVREYVLSMIDSRRSRAVAAQAEEAKETAETVRHPKSAPHPPPFLSSP